MRAILFASAAIMFVLGLSTVSVSYRTVARVEERINQSLRALEQDSKLTSYQDGWMELYRSGPYFAHIEAPWQWAMLEYFFAAGVMVVAAVKWPSPRRRQPPVTRANDPPADTRSPCS